MHESTDAALRTAMQLRHFEAVRAALGLEVVAPPVRAVLAQPPTPSSVPPPSYPPLPPAPRPVPCPPPSLPPCSRPAGWPLRPKAAPTHSRGRALVPPARNRPEIVRDREACSRVLTVATHAARTMRLACTQVKEHASLVLLTEARALLESGAQADAAPTNGGGGAPPPPAAPMRLGAAPPMKPRYGLPLAGAGANGSAGGGACAGGEAGGGAVSGAPSLPPLGVADGGRPPGLPALAPISAPVPPPPLPPAALVPPPLSPPPASPPAQFPLAVTMGVLEPQLSPHHRTVDAL
jgi:hypothetical protein